MISITDMDILKTLSTSRLQVAFLLALLALLYSCLFQTLAKMEDRVEFQTAVYAEVGRVYQEVKEKARAARAKVAFSRLKPDSF